MTTEINNELLTLARLAADYITRLNGEKDSFEVTTDNFTAYINYEAEIGEDPGTYWTAPLRYIESETAIVEAVLNNDGEEDKEAAEFLQKMLN